MCFCFNILLPVFGFCSNFLTGLPYLNLHSFPLPLSITIFFKLQKYSCFLCCESVQLSFLLLTLHCLLTAQRGMSEESGGCPKLFTPRLARTLPPPMLSCWKFKADRLSIPEPHMTFHPSTSLHRVIFLLWISCSHYLPPPRKLVVFKMQFWGSFL